MPNPAPLTDRSALLRHRARAQGADALFLHDLAIENVQDRLAMVNRSFNAPAIVTGHGEKWRDLLPGARIVADDDTLALTPGAHDLVVHALCLHWANDPVGQLIQCRRALRPDGLLVAVLFGGESLHELRAALTRAESRVSGGLSPRIVPMADIRDLGALMQRAGLALPVADSQRLTIRYKTLRALMHDLRAMGETSALTARPRHAMRRVLLDEAERIYRHDHSDAEGRLPATAEMITLTGWAPDASQPKPLRPGSAKARLADALGTQETPLKD